MNDFDWVYLATPDDDDMAPEQFGYPYCDGKGVLVAISGVRIHILDDFHKNEGYYSSDGQGNFYLLGDVLNSWKFPKWKEGCPRGGEKKIWKRNQAEIVALRGKGISTIRNPHTLSEAYRLAPDLFVNKRYWDEAVQACDEVIWEQDKKHARDGIHAHIWLPDIQKNRSAIIMPIAFTDAEIAFRN